MAIKSVGDFNSLLNGYNAKEWTKSADIGVKSPISKYEFPNLEAPNKTFGQFLTDSISKVNNMQVEANSAVQRLVTGETKNLHETLLLVEKAELAFRTMNQMRQKVLDAYKEVMKMQV